MAFVDPDTVTMRSGHDPSEILIFAPDCGYTKFIHLDNFNVYKWFIDQSAYLFAKPIHNFTFLPNNTANFLQKAKPKTFKRIIIDMIAAMVEMDEYIEGPLVR